MPLQYPLLFPFGERGFQVGVLYNGILNRDNWERKRVQMTMQDYYCYQFHYKPDQPNPFLSYGVLSSQAKVDASACIDENRLSYILNNQKKLHTENFQGIADAISKGGDEMGKVVVLPASHIGGMRYMIQNYHDSISICRVYGPPDFFFTCTCNTKWPEIKNIFYKAEQNPSDKSNVILSLKTRRINR
jgi:hypothetical protein